MEIYDAVVTVSEPQMKFGFGPHKILDQLCFVKLTSSLFFPNYFKTISNKLTVLAERSLKRRITCQIKHFITRERPDIVHREIGKMVETMNIKWESI